MSVKWAARLLLAAIVLVVLYCLTVHLHWDRRVLEEWLKGAGPVAPLLGIGLMLLQTLLSPIPFAVVVMALGAVLGPWWGALTSWVGALLGATLAYWLAATGLKANLPKVRKLGFFALLGVRLIPGISADLISYGCGAARVPFGVFLSSTALGLIPRTLAFSLFGHELWDDPRQGVFLVILLVPLIGVMAYVLSRSGMQLKADRVLSEGLSQSNSR